MLHWRSSKTSKGRGARPSSLPRKVHNRPISESPRVYLGALESLWGNFNVFLTSSSKTPSMHPLYALEDSEMGCLRPSSLRYNRPQPPMSEAPSVLVDNNLTRLKWAVDAFSFSLVKLLSTPFQTPQECTWELWKALEKPLKCSLQAPQRLLLCTHCTLLRTLKWGGQQLDKAERGGWRLFP
jgi:hypothetical protein